MLRKSRLNNLQLGYSRNDPIYEAVMADLTLLGVITVEVFEELTNRVFNQGLKLPEGTEELMDV